MGMKQRKGKMSMRKRWGRKAIACLTAAAMIGTMFPQSADFIGKGVQAEEAESVTTEDLQKGLLAYYGFEDNVQDSVSGLTGKEVTKGTLEEVSGNSTISYQAGIKGKALKTAGEETNGVKLPDIKTTGDDYTISFWMNVTAASDFTALLFTPDFDGEGYLNVMPQGWGDPKLFPQIRFQKTGADIVNGIDHTQVLNTWKMVTLSVQGAELTAYVDGVKKRVFINPETLEKGKVFQGFYKKGKPLYVGVNFWDKTYNGLIDELYVYDRALSEEEVALRYELDRTSESGKQQITDNDINTYYSAIVNGAGVSVHDPSIISETVEGKTTYYVFGSHLSFAKSTDLVNWTPLTNNINEDFDTLFAKEAKWASGGEAGYVLHSRQTNSGNIWAPDVIWNEQMEKWCMYMSINGNSWNSSICMLTADHLDGDWTYAGTVIYSGFSKENYHNYKDTDYEQVTGDTGLADRYVRDSYNANKACQNTTWNNRYGAHAIDPCVFYDQSGKLWMTYGSWSGGIYIIELDQKTGFRDISHKYEYVADGDNPSDPYMGIRIAGGNNGTGEASYIQYINGYYYLFVTYGGLTATGGYNMRLFRAENVTGPYKDVSGQNAVGQQGNADTNVGLRVMGYHKWSWWSAAQVAQGHNSVYYDEKTGGIYLFCHTRTDLGNEWHYMIVHQMFLNEDGWLCTSPFQYDGKETLAKGLTAKDVAGIYEMTPMAATKYASLESTPNYVLELKEDGTISCDDPAYAGTWEFGKEPSNITMTLNGVVYKGVLADSTLEGIGKQTLSLSLIGSSGNAETALWAAKLSDDIIVVDNVKNIAMPSIINKSTVLPKAVYGAELTWSGSVDGVVAADGTITLPEKATSMDLTLTVKKGKYYYETTKPVNVMSKSAGDSDAIFSYFVDDPQDLSVHMDQSLFINNPFFGMDTSNGVSVKFDVETTGDVHQLGTILSFMGNEGNNGRMYFTPGTYLGYNGMGGFFDANLDLSLNEAGDKKYWLAKNYLNTEGVSTVEIKIVSTGFEVYVDGKLAYDKTVLLSPDQSTGAGDVKNYLNVLDWLSNTANKVYFGYGSFWNGVGYDEANCKISNVEFYLLPEEVSTHLYEQNYNKVRDAKEVWTDGYTDFVSVDNDTVHGNYMKYTHGASGNRGIYMTFPENAQLAGNYILETDLALRAGRNGGSGANADTKSQFIVTNSEWSAGNAVNAGYDKNYVLKLGTDADNRTTWIVNDNAEKSFSAELGAWVHIKAVVNAENKTVEVTITGADGEILFSDKVACSGSSVPQGLYVLAGRGDNMMAVDNTVLDSLMIKVDKLSVADKVYDATTAASIKEITFSGTEEAVDYTAEASFDTAEAGENKKVTVKIALTSGSAVKYSLEQDTVETTASIAKADPAYTLPTGLTAVEGQTLKDITLPAGFSFQDALTTSVGEAGTHEFEVIFTPEDTKNYNVVTGIKVTVTVTEKSTGGTGGFGGGTISGGTGSAGSSSSTNTENNGGDSTQPDNSGDNNTPSTNPENNVTTETKPDGTVVETTTETAADGTVKETVTETQTDGTVSSTVTETKPDGSKTEKKEVKMADDTTLLVEAETKADGTSTAKSVIKTGTTGQSGTVEIAESLLQAVAEDDRMDRVAVQITDTTVNSAVTGSKNTVVSVNIPSVEGVDVDVVLNKDSITAAKSSGKGLKVNVANGGTEGYVVTIPAKQLAKISGNVEELNITIAVEKAADVSDASKKDTITNLVTKSKGKTAKTCVVGIAENTNVTAGMNVKVPVKETAGNSSQVYIYKYDKKSGKLVEVANSKQKVASDGTVSIAAKEGTDYVVSAKKLSGKNVETIKDGISVSVSKKSVKAGKAVSAKVSLPETVSKKAKFGTEKATIAYKSSNSKVASVSKNGKIKAKKKGTVVITVTVKLSSGQKVTEKRKIKIK